MKFLITRGFCAREQSPQFCGSTEDPRGETSPRDSLVPRQRVGDHRANRFTPALRKFQKTDFLSAGRNLNSPRWCAVGIAHNFRLARFRYRRTALCMPFRFAAVECHRSRASIRRALVRDPVRSNLRFDSTRDPPFWREGVTQHSPIRRITPTDDFLTSKQRASEFVIFVLDIYSHIGIYFSHGTSGDDQ
jgi:hypothetical protein